MTTPLYLTAAGTLDGLGPGDQLVLDGEEGRHAATVRRTRAGEPVDVADGAGRVARCVAEQPGRDRLVLRVRRVEEVPPRHPRLVLVQALAKGGRDEQALETATELGVDAVVPWQAARSVAVWTGERAERGRRRWEATARAAAKQSRRATVPVVEPLVTTGSLVGRAAGHSLLVLHEEAGTGLGEARLPLAGTPTEVLVAVGPEGGIGDDELGRLLSAGATAVRLGAEVLRTSSAGPAALALLNWRLGRWA